MRLLDKGKVFKLRNDYYFLVTGAGEALEDMGRKVVPVIKPAERMVHDNLVPPGDGDASSEVSKL